MNPHNDPYIIGSGSRKVICLHGWTGHAQGWGPLINELDRNQFTYAFMNCRGYGDRQNTPGPYSMEQISRDVQGLADQLGWHAFALVGHSMGGSAIQYTLADVPERVQCMVGIAPVPASGVPFDDKGWSLYNAATSEPKARRAVLNFLSGKRQPAEWLDEMVANSMKHTQPDALADYLESWARTDFSDRIKGKPTPVQVIVGRHDPAMSEDTSNRTWMQYYPNAELQVIEGASHFPMHETPRELAEIMENYLHKHMPL